MNVAMPGPHITGSPQSDWWLRTFNLVFDYFDELKDRAGAVKERA